MVMVVEEEEEEDGEEEVAGAVVEEVAAGADVGDAAPGTYCCTIFVVNANQCRLDGLINDFSISH